MHWLGKPHAQPASQACQLLSLPTPSAAAICYALFLAQEDPWERIEWGRQFVTGSKYPSIEEFVPLPGVGHCPQDEAPHLVHPVIQRFVQRHWP